jgi:alpha-tubulin suppressor-like RCC1 family protein
MFLGHVDLHSFSPINRIPPPYLSRRCAFFCQAGEYRFEAIVAEHLQPAPPLLKGGGALPVIKAVGTGTWHLFLVAAAGSTVYVAGLNNYGQLGLGDVVNRSELEAVPKLNGCGVTEVGGGQHYSMAICASFASRPSSDEQESSGGGREGGGGDTVGRVITWGRSDYGQLGIGPTDDGAGAFVTTPVEVVLPLGSGCPLQMSCGGNHNLVLTDRHHVYSWGFGEMGSLGQGSDTDEWAPKRIDLAKVKLAAPGAVTLLQVAGGGQHSMLLGRVVS